MIVIDLESHNWNDILLDFFHRVAWVDALQVELGREFQEICLAKRNPR